MQGLPVRKVGDKPTGEPCIVPAGLSYCEICDCYQRTELKFIRVDGYPYPVCIGHSSDEIKAWRVSVAITSPVENVFDVV